MSLIGAVRGRAVAVILLVLVLVAVGVYETLRMPSAIFPSVTFPQVKVIADAGEEPAARMMPTVTRPLEEAILRVPGIRTVRSTTARGSSELSAQFAWGTDMQVALQRVQAETQRVSPDLPSGTRVDVEWMNPAIFPIEGYALTSDRLSQADLRTLAEYTLKPALIRIPGVSQVQIQGGRNREFRVELWRSALVGRGIAVTDVVNAIKADNQVLSAGLAERNHELYLVLVNGRVHDLEALGRISVPSKSGPPARLSELGRLEVADEISYVRTTADGHPAVLVNIVRQPSANTVDIAAAVKKLLADRPDLVPDGVRWTTFYDQARFVSASVQGTLDAILIGVGFAALVLLTFLRSWRLTLTAVVCLPITVAIVGIALALLGETINLMTLAGVAASIGLIADDAIVVIENIHRHREQGSPDPVASGLGEIWPAMIGSSLSISVILVPFAMLSGVVGAFFKPLALTMALILTVSFVVAVVVVPLIARLVERPAAAASGRVSAYLHRVAPIGLLRRLGRWAGGGYRGVARLFTGHGWLAAALLGLLVAGGYWLYRALGTDFLPSMDEGSIILDYWTPPGTSLTDTNEMLDAAERQILALPDVLSYSRRTGTQLGFFITEPNRGDYVINLKPRGQRRPIDQVIDDLRARLARVEPAIHTDFGQLLEDNIGDLTGGTPQPVDVKIFGSSTELLQSRAKQIARLVETVPGAEDVFDGIVVAGPALEIRIDPIAAARYQLTTADLHAALAPVMVGEVVDQVRLGERMYDLRVLASGPEPLDEVRIRTPSGALLPIRDVATVTTGQPEAEIDRQNLETYVGVTARVSGASLSAVMDPLKRRIASQVTLAPGMHIEYGGLYQQQQASFRELLGVLLAGLLLVSIVVLFEFADWRAPLVVAPAALATLAGSFIALWLTGTTLNISSYVGAIMMVGIAGENAIFVINEARLELRHGRPPREAWARASRLRLRPVAMTILATGFALAPLAFAFGQGSQLMQPLAIAVIGGFVLSGPIVLFAVPGFYRWLDPRGRLAGRPGAEPR